MTSAKAISGIRNSALLALCTTYIGQCFIRWEINPQKWGDDGRGMFMLAYFTALFLYSVGYFAIKDFTTDSEKKK
jgi:hypothetical protein